MSDLQGLENEHLSTQVRYRIGQVLEWIEGARNHTDGLKEQIEISKCDEERIDRHLDGGVTTLVLALTGIVEKTQIAYQAARAAENQAAVPIEEKRRLHFVDEMSFWEELLSGMLLVQAHIAKGSQDVQALCGETKDENLKKALDSHLAELSTARSAAHDIYRSISERNDAIREVFGGEKKPKAKKKTGGPK